MQRTYYPPLVDENHTIDLTAGQALVLERVLLGHQNTRIGIDLHYATDTVKSHVQKIMKKAGAANRGHLIALIYSGAVRVLVPAGESYFDVA